MKLSTPVTFLPDTLSIFIPTVVIIAPSTSTPHPATSSAVIFFMHLFHIITHGSWERGRSGEEQVAPKYRILDMLLRN